MAKGCLLIVLVGLLCVGGCFFFVDRTIRTADPFLSTNNEPSPPAKQQAVAPTEAKSGFAEISDEQVSEVADLMIKSANNSESGSYDRAKKLLLKALSIAEGTEVEQTVRKALIDLDQKMKSQVVSETTPATATPEPSSKQP
jgi:hypothetical protein